MKTLWMAINDLTGPPAGTRIFRLTPNGAALHRCRVCEATFPQTQEGWDSLLYHEFDVHERAVHYDWAELDGMRVTIRVIRRVDEERSYIGQSNVQTELVAVADDGTVYCLPFSYYQDGDAGGFKFRPQAAGLRLLESGA